MLIKEPLVNRYDSILAVIAIVNKNETDAKELQTGFYQIGHFGSSYWPSDEYEGYFDLDNESSYGVCDNVEQILELYPTLQDPVRQFIVTITPVIRAKQSKEGGWRWHKWGPYIGNYNRKHEYLYDEDIDQVLVYHIYEKRP